MYVLLLVVIAASIPFAHAQLLVSDIEYIWYYDSQNVYTVVGAIKNTGDEYLQPTITITIHDSVVHDEQFTLSPIAPHSEQPFKLRFPHLNLADPILGKPEISHNPVKDLAVIDVDVIYDDTLVLHPDGHQTGRIINNGDEEVKFVRVYALIYSEDKQLLDMGQSTHIFESLGPGQTANFTIYPDPSVASKAKYYSCFAVGDSTIIAMEILRKGASYTIRYDSGAWFAYHAFNDEGTVLSMKTQNSFPLAMLANFEFPRNSDSETFDVVLNGEPVEHAQSLDEMGNWHLTFEMPPHTSGFVAV